MSDHEKYELDVFDGKERQFGNRDAPPALSSCICSHSSVNEIPLCLCVLLFGINQFSGTSCRSGERSHQWEVSGQTTNHKQKEKMLAALSVPFFLFSFSAGAAVSFISSRDTVQTRPRIISVVCGVQIGADHIDRILGHRGR